MEVGQNCTELHFQNVVLSTKMCSVKMMKTFWVIPLQPLFFFLSSILPFRPEITSCCCPESLTSILSVKNGLMCRSYLLTNNALRHFFLKVLFTPRKTTNYACSVPLIVFNMIKERSHYPESFWTFVISPLALFLIS